MKSQSFSVTITPATLDRWRSELEEIEEKIKGLEQRRQKLSARIHAVQFFLDDEEPQVSIPGIPPRPPDTLLETESMDKPVAQMGVPEAIRYVLKRVNRPMSNTELKKTLRALGFPMEKFGVQGGYFYTALGRMERSGTIKRDGNTVMESK